MQIVENVSLTEFSTMRLGGNARYLTEVASRNEVSSALAWAAQGPIPVIMIGIGSNIVWKDEGFPGLVIVNKIMGYEAQEIDETNVYLTLGAGENWDSVVERSVAAGLTGIEALSLVPGTTGATPVQNVGAYGQEISQTLATIEAFDSQTSQFITLRPEDCNFGYRTSRFKTTDKGRYYITGLTLHLTRGNPMPPFYASVQSYFEQHGIAEYTPQTLRQAVVAIRTSKLPDPSVVNNTGSFFANPIISRPQFSELFSVDAQPPHWDAGEENMKLSAAWLIEQAGFKDFHDSDTGMATWPTQSLVLVNEKARTTADLLAFKQKIVEAVQTKFGITLVQEPELLP